MRRLNISFLIKKQRKNVLIGQKIRENSASFFVKTWRELNSYLVKLQLYICGIWKSWVPSWNRTNLLSRQSETLLIIISFNFSQIKAIYGLSIFHLPTYLMYVLLSELQEKISWNRWCTKIRKSLTKDLWLQCEIEQTCCHDKVKHC